MTNDIPQIDDLTKGINDSDFFLGKPKEDVEEPAQQMKTEPTLKEGEAEAEVTDKCWNVFMGFLESSDEQKDKSDRLVCKLDRDLADSLDDCNIHNRCRSDLVNAIVRSFFENYLQQLAQYRREKKSLFTNLKDE
ncbi:hypothetical protein [Bacteroides sp. D2]|jgi:hypothetical protein|uniref:hypothetical protein n=1 Tax=Bacteroides TaxID=816 RepID=UPI0001BC7A6B|nr:hypothetical protein [Bacteroides sp. D2]EFS33495.1 hypothetical protein BSGG_4195 [Bacteroides sp. D2]UWN98838.1 hypothetical protein NQ505_20790 [Bacteroides sp. D2]